MIHTANAAPLGIAFLGLLLGMRHATDPDHVIAVTTILSQERRIGAAARIGVVWGVGHTATVLALGSAIIFFKVAIPVRWGVAMELGVALMLIVLGVGNIAGFLRRFASRHKDAAENLQHAESLIVHSHPHHHGHTTHRHPHVHRRARGVSSGHDEELHREHLMRSEWPTSPALRRPMLTSFGVGFVHGLSGSVAIALLVLSAIPQPLWAGLYLVVFCCGTIIGMALITAAIAAPMFFASGRMSWLHGQLVASSGFLSLGFGIFLFYRLAIGHRF
jgi:high-affinity nickel permease